MKKKLFYETRLFFTALMFFTRLPVPRNVYHGAEYLQRSSKYFSWIGLIVGSISALTTLLLLQWFSTEISLLLGMVSGVITTGAFHEDGFADVCDAFGGGWTKETILAIMKDSRLGTFGVIGLGMILSLKFFLLKEIITHFGTSMKLNNEVIPAWLAIITWAHTVSRFAAITVTQRYDYVSDSQRSKSQSFVNRKLTLPDWITATVPMAIPILILPLSYLFALPCVFLSTLLLGRYFNKWIGGYTGDCLGAVQQIGEVVIYLTITVIWRFT
jgi:adenosylcobinamide-GDP ribazoletransferase